VQEKAARLSNVLWTISFIGLAVFIPFSIAGDNFAIMTGFVGSIVGVLFVPEIRKKYRDIRHDPLCLASILLVALAIPSVLMSENRHRAMKDWKSYWIILVYFLVAYNLTSARLRRALFWTLFASTTLSCLVAFVQYRGGLHFLFIHIAEKRYRPSSTLYTMTFAGILYQLITVHFAVALEKRASRRRFALLGSGVLVQTLALLFTLTRGAWMALIGGLFSVPALVRRRALFAAGVALVVLAAVFASQNATLRNRAETVLGTARATHDKNISTRLVLWDISWEIFKKHPLLGVGMGDYSTEAEKLLAARRVTTTVDSHNIYLQVIATRGLVGFIPFIFFWIALFRMLLDVRRHAARFDGFGYHFAAGVIAAAVAVLIGALSENNIDDSEVFIAFMFIVGVARNFRLVPSVDPDPRVES
jgi:O-antigen ligase